MRGLQRVRAERDLDIQDMRRAKQPFGVLAQAENGRAFFGFIRAYAFEHAHAIMQGVGEHVYVGIAPIDPLPVHPNNAVSVTV